MGRSMVAMTFFVLGCEPAPEHGFGFGYADEKIEVLAEWDDRQCPVALEPGGAPEEPCLHADECAEYCCACSDSSVTFSARACDTRRCADAEVACTAAEAHVRATDEPGIARFCAD